MKFDASGIEDLGYTLYTRLLLPSVLFFAFLHLLTVSPHFKFAHPQLRYERDNGGNWDTIAPQGRGRATIGIQSCTLTNQQPQWSSLIVKLLYKHHQIVYFFKRFVHTTTPWARTDPQWVQSSSLVIYSKTLENLLKNDKGTNFHINLRNRIHFWNYMRLWSRTAMLHASKHVLWNH